MLLIINNLDCVAGEVEFELSIEALQAIEFKRFRAKMILCGGVFSEAPVTDHRAVYPRVSRRDGSKV